MTRITLAEKDRQLTERKDALGIVGCSYVMPNSGARRTPAKRELLRTIERAAEARGEAPRFAANIG